MSDRRVLKGFQDTSYVSEAVQPQFVRFEKYETDEALLFKHELDSILPRFLHLMRSRQRDPASLIDILDVVLEDAEQIIIEQCEARYSWIMERKGHKNCRLKDRIREIIFTILLAGSYCQAVPEFLKYTHPSYDVLPYRSWYCTLDEFHAFTEAIESLGKNERGPSLPMGDDAII